MCMTVQPDRIYPAWTLGDRLRKARTQCRMTQEEFAANIGVKEGSLAAWETDRAQPRSVVAVARRIEQFTGIPASWTLGLDDPEPLPPPPPPTKTTDRFQVVAALHRFSHGSAA
jgi:transcriptional regulator with XRE-family HTH domain